jgi:hypothetical protein
MEYSKYRFAKQIRDNDCAPNVIINLMKFNGVKIPYKHSYKRLYDFFEISVYGGTSPTKLSKYLTTRRIPKSQFVDFKFNPSIEKIAKILNGQRAIVLAFHSAPQKNGHVCLMVGINKEGFVVVNYTSNKAVQTVPFDKFKKEVLDFKKALFYVYERKN